MEGFLTYNASTCSFWIYKDGANIQELNFGDEFEVKVDDEWVKTTFEIITGDDGEMTFRLKNTNYYGKIDGVEVRI